MSFQPIANTNIDIEEGNSDSEIFPQNLKELVPVNVQEEIIGLLENDEKTITIDINVIMVLGVGPIVFFATLYNYWNRNNSYTIFTTHRIITKPPTCTETTSIVSYSEVLDVELHYNWLQLREEIHVRSKPIRYQPSILFIESIPNINRYIELIKEKAHIVVDNTI